MKQAFTLFFLFCGGLIAVDVVFGFGAAYAISYGAISLMGLMISGTFFWLWYKRATPLALGMSFSWAGASTVMGWWWLYRVFERPEAMEDNAALLGFVSLYCVGAILHFGVIQSSLSLPRVAYIFPVIGSLLVSLLIHITV
ncbi:MAG: hypothetical protein AAGM21_06230 [Pseudomonadota bacterium]